MPEASNIIERWKQIICDIGKLQHASALAQREAVLIAVSKGQPEPKLAALLEAGQRVFGENRVQEADAKWPALRARFSGIELHLIGSLQTNKVKEALALFDVIQTVDREGLVDALVKPTYIESVRAKKFFIQVNTGHEPQKGGVTPEHARTLLDYCRARGLPVCGLMCVPPDQSDPSAHFSLLYKMAQEFGLPELSMGMSGDYETAIRLGATCVRVGTALFGKRD